MANTEIRSMHSKVSGVSFDDRQQHCKSLQVGQVLYVLHEKDNPFDPSALKLFIDEQRTKTIGYLSRELARDLVAQAERGWSYVVKVSALTGGGEKTTGVNVTIEASKADAADPASAGGPGWTTSGN